MQKNYFALRYPNNPELVYEKETDDGIKHVVLNSNYPAEYKNNEKLVLKISGNPAGSSGNIIFLHGTGQKNLKHLLWFIKNMPEYGFSGTMMILPYHFDRTPIGYKSGELFMETNATLLRNRFENAVVDTLTTVNYLKQFDKPIYIMGYSFGGFIAVISASLCKDIKKLSLVVTGGNFYHITWKSFATKVLRVKYEEDETCNEKKCCQLHKNEFRDYIKDLKKPEIEVDSAPKECFEYDPLTFAKFVDQPTILFEAIFDIFIPKASSQELNKALPNSRLHRLPTGHLSSILFKKNVLKKTVEHFKINH
ncbi:MAG: alpha/beta hydrolase family protein [Thermotogota bacterium]|nr:alpha/beta hydrolase family protein [Thermotogota bacterium]